MIETHFSMQLPGLTKLSLEEPPVELIYRIELTPTHDNQDRVHAKVAFVRNGIIAAESVIDITEWSLQSALYSGSLAHTYRISSENTKKKTVVDVKKSANWIGTKLWEDIHSTQDMHLPWEQFMDEVDRFANSQKFIVVSGKGACLSTPFETLQFAKQIGEFVQAYNIPIVRSVKGQYQESKSFSQETLPNTIIALFGKDSFDKSAIDYRQEILMWFKLLHPNSEVDESEIRMLLSLGGTVEKTTNLPFPLSIKIIPKGDLTHLQKVIQEQEDPFLFVYIGHGSYDNNANEKDGHLHVLPLPGTSINTEIRMHDQLLTILKNSPIQGVFLNCCEGFRNYDSSTADDAADRFSTEVNYFNQLRNLQIVSGFQSKVADSNARSISVQLIRSILDQQSIYEFASNLNKEFLIKSTLNEFTHQQLVRDQISRVFLIQ